MLWRAGCADQPFPASNSWAGGSLMCGVTSSAVGSRAGSASWAQTAHPLWGALHFITCDFARKFCAGGERNASKNWRLQFGVALECIGCPLHALAILGFAGSKLFKKKEISMRSDLVFRALSHVSNRYQLCQLASKATRKLHKPNTRLQDTTNEVLNRFQQANPEGDAAEETQALEPVERRRAA